MYSLTKVPPSTPPVVTRPHYQSHYDRPAPLGEKIAVMLFLGAVVCAFFFRVYYSRMSSIADAEAKRLFKQQAEDAAAAVVAEAKAAAEKVERMAMERHIAYIKGPEVYWKLVEEL
jgi:hypothetical protein